MIFLRYMIPLLSALLTDTFVANFFIPIFLLAFVATVPVILRHFFMR